MASAPLKLPTQQPSFRNSLSQSKYAGNILQSSVLYFLNPKKTLFSKTKYVKRFVIATKDYQILGFNGPTMLDKPTFLIQLTRDSSVLDIDNHQNQKNTFGIKVKLTEDLKSKLNMKKSKEESVIYWFYTILPADRNEWVMKIKQAIMEMREGSRALTSQIVEAVIKDQAKEVSKFLNDAVIHLEATANFQRTRGVSTLASPRNGQSATSPRGTNTTNPTTLISPRNLNSHIDAVTINTASLLTTAPLTSNTLSLEEQQQQQQLEDATPGEADSDDEEQVQEEIEDFQQRIQRFTELGVVPGDTMLIIACRSGALEVVKKLVEKNANINHQNNEGVTALHALLQYTPQKLSQESLREQLLQQMIFDNDKVDLNLQERKQANATIHLAMLKKEFKLAEKIIDTCQQCDINLSNREGMTALHLAVEGQHMKSVKTLLKKQVNANKLNQQQLTPLDLALSSSQREMASLLLQYMGDASMDHVPSTTAALYLPFVVELGQLQRLQSIVQLYPDLVTSHTFVNSKQETVTLFIYAIQQNQFELVKWLLLNYKDALLEKKQVATAQQDILYTAMHCAMMTRNEELIRFLVQQYPVESLLETSGPHHYYPVMLVLEYDLSSSLLDLLLERMPFLEEPSLSKEEKIEKLIRTLQGSNEYNLLHLACNRGNVELMQYLFEHGAEPRQPSKYGQYCISNACQSGNLTAVKYLVEEIGLSVEGSGYEQYCEEGYPPLHAAVISGNVEVVKYLLSKSETLHVNYARLEHQKRPIHLACIYGKTDMANYLIEERHCDVNVTINTKDDKELTPLHLAAAYGQEQIVNLLIDKGHANVEQKTANGLTALDYAVKKLQLTVVKALCERGVVSDQLTLQLAILTGKDEVLEWIENAKQVRNSRQSLQQINPEEQNTLEQVATEEQKE